MKSSAPKSVLPTEHQQNRTENETTADNNATGYAQLKQLKTNLVTAAVTKVRHRQKNKLLEN